MLLNFSLDRLKYDKTFVGLSSQQRKSCLGQLKSYDYKGTLSAIRFLEKAGIVQVNWDYCCPCGLCDPEPLVDLPWNHV